MFFRDAIEAFKSRFIYLAYLVTILKPSDENYSFFILANVRGKSLPYPTQFKSHIWSGDSM